MMAGGNFGVCTNISAVAGKIAGFCSDYCCICFLNDSAVLKKPNTICYILTLEHMIQ